MSSLWGVDLGGTKIEGVVLDAETLDVQHRARIPTEKQKGYRHIIQRIGILLDQISQEVGHQPTKLGIGTPGTVDPLTGLHKNSNTTVLNGQLFKKDLSTHLGIPVKMANDANCFAVAEARMGAVPKALPEAEVVFGVIMGTGVGGGLVINGQVINGRQGIAGEWGHNFLDESGGDCYCGKSGCVEKILAGPWLEKFYEQQAGQKRKLKAIVQDHLAGIDPIATATINRLIQFFGIGISTIVNLLDPDAIVIGGGVGNIDLLYTAGVEEVKKHVFNPRLDTVFLKPTLGDSAGVFGAALL